MGLFDSLANIAAQSIQAGIEANEQIKSMSPTERQRKEKEQQLAVSQQRAAQFEQAYSRDYEAFLSESVAWYKRKKSSKEFTARLERAKVSKGLYDFTSFDGLDAEMLEDASNSIRIPLYDSYKKWATAAAEGGFYTQFFALTSIRQFAYWDAFRPIVERTTKNFEYFRTDECIGSVLAKRMRQTDEENERTGAEFDANEFSRFLTEGTAFDALIECGLADWYPKRSEYRAFIDAVADAAGKTLKPSVEDLVTSTDLVSDDFIQAMDIVAGADKEVDDFDMIKIALLRASYEESEELADVLVFDFLKDAAKVLLGSMVGWDEDGERKGGVALPVDVIIAEANKLEKTGMMDEIDSLLAEQLPLYLHASFDVAYELKVLANMFGSIGAYKQELAVFEFMVSNNLPRSEQTEARIAFLRSGNASKAASLANRLKVDYMQDEEKLAIDYRTITWSDSQISALFDMHSGNNDLQTTPLVVAEWNKNIATGSVRWNNDEVALKIRACMEENFGDSLEVLTKEVAVIMDGELDYTDSIVIQPSQSARYPWLGFVLSGEQMTLKQAALSLFALYFPEHDFAEEKNSITRNNKAANRTLMLKMRQNPRTNNYIGMVETLVVESLEAYFNAAVSEDIY